MCFQRVPAISNIEQLTEADSVDPAIVGDDRKVLHAGLDQRVDQILGNAAKAEAARHHGHAVMGKAGKRGCGVWIDLLQGGPPSEREDRRM